jgi:hypothetical protein
MLIKIFSFFKVFKEEKEIYFISKNMLDLKRYDYVVKVFDALKLDDANFWSPHLNMVTTSLLHMVNYYLNFS